MKHKEYMKRLPIIKPPPAWRSIAGTYAEPGYGEGRGR